MNLLFMTTFLPGDLEPAFIRLLLKPGQHVTEFFKHDVAMLLCDNVWRQEP